MFIRILILLIVTACLPIVANATTYFTANLNGTAAVPANTSPGSGFARITLNDAEDQITVSIYYGNPGSLSGGLTGGHVHSSSGPGVSGPILFDLVPTVGTNNGAIVGKAFPVALDQVAGLKAGKWYINIHTTLFPDGEIRGQFSVDSPFVAYIDNNQENPPTSSSARGSGAISLNEATNQAITTLNWSGLSGNATGAYLYLGRVGTNGSAICELAPSAAPSGLAIDKLCSLDASLVRALKSAQLYVSFRTASAPNGEIRGQVQRRNSTVCDYDGDGKTDAAIIRANYPNMEWWIRNSSDGSSSAYTFGLYTDFYYRPVVCGDYDGDGKDDLALWRTGASPNAIFYVFQSGNFVVRQEQFGTTGDDPRIPEDYDGDGRTDIAVFRQSDGTWYYMASANNPSKKVTAIRWGTQYANPGDYDGDGRGDFVDQQGSNFWLLGSRDSAVKVITFGPNLAFGAPGDYDGDGRTDIGIHYLENTRMVWYYRSSVDPAQNPYSTRRDWGGTGAELPKAAQGDYDGDGTTDYAVWIHSELPTETPKFWILPSNGSPPIVIPWGMYTPATAYADSPVAGYNNR